MVLCNLIFDWICLLVWISSFRHVYFPLEHLRKKLDYWLNGLVPPFQLAFVSVPRASAGYYLGRSLSIRIYFSDVWNLRQRMVSLSDLKWRTLLQSDDCETSDSLHTRNIQIQGTTATLKRRARQTILLSNSYLCRSCSLQKALEKGFPRVYFWLSYRYQT
jgi:hypothetical protein